MELATATIVETAEGPVLSIPTSHSLGELARLALPPKRISGTVVHGYFHDTDLLDTRRRRALVASLAVLGRRRTACDLDTLAADIREHCRDRALGVASPGVRPPIVGSRIQAGRAPTAPTERPAPREESLPTADAPTRFCLLSRTVLHVRRRALASSSNVDARVARGRIR